MDKSTGRPGLSRGLRQTLTGLALVARMTVTLVSGISAQASLDIPDVTAKSVYAFNPGTGEVIVAENANERLSIGSVTKIATALVALDHLGLTDEIAIASSDMVAPGFSAMGLQPGDTLTVEQLLTGLLVVSGGDAAQALARTAGAELSGSDDHASAVAAFVAAMNAKASELQLGGTHFANPDGADSPDAWSTARDVAVMYAFLDANPALAGIAAAPEFSFISVGPEQTPYAGISTNQMNGEYGVLSAKTGSTGAAGGCLVLARSISGTGGKIIVAILGSELAYDDTLTPRIDERWNDARTVLDEIDGAWTPGQFIVDVATEPAFVANTSATGSRLEPQALALTEPDSRATTGPHPQPLLAVSVATAVLALAGVFAWSRILPSRI